MKRIMISGGGTGGHIFPAIAIAQEIQKRFPESVILFAGAKGKMEMEKVPKAGFPIVGLWISGLQRKVTLGNLLFPVKVVFSIVKSYFILKKFKPEVVVGVGGFASGPLLYTAAVLGIPTLIHEQNSYAGITNKWLSGKVNKICTAYDDMHRFFPENKIVFTGNPVRVNLTEKLPPKQQAAETFGLSSDFKTVLVIGGSLGAASLNNALASGISKLNNAKIQVLWQTGALYIDKLKHLNSQSIRVVDFIYEMNMAFSLADIVVSRAGAGSIAELMVVAKPVILVPSPNVAEDHQTKNAMAVTEYDAAVLVKDADAANILVTEAISLIHNPARQHQLSSNIARYAVTDAASRITDELVKLLPAK